MNAPRWDACTMDPHHWMRFIECHPGFASYIQAAVVSVTLLGAIFYPPLRLAYEKWLRAYSRKKEAKRYAYSLLPEVETIISGMADRLASLQAVYVTTPPNWVTFQEQLGIVIPMMLMAVSQQAEYIAVERLHFLTALAEKMVLWNNKRYTYQLVLGDVEGWHAMAGDMTALGDGVLLAAEFARLQTLAMGKPPRQ
jgi:hypothetical protein